MYNAGPHGDQHKNASNCSINGIECNDCSKNGIEAQIKNEIRGGGGDWQRSDEALSGLVQQLGWNSSLFIVSVGSWDEIRLFLLSLLVVGMKFVSFDCLCR